MDNSVFVLLFLAGCAGILLAFVSKRSRARFAADAFPTAGRRAGAYALLAVVLLTTVALPFAGGLAGPEPETRRLSFVSLFAVHAILLAFLFAYYALSGRRRTLPHFLELTSARPLPDLSSGILVGAAGWLLTIFLAALFVGIYFVLRGAPPGGASGRVSPMILWLVGLPIAARLAIVASAMFVEELFFRSFLQTRVGPLAATLMFTAAHGVYGQPLVLVGILVISAVLSLTFALYGNVLPCIVAHGVFDSIQMFVVIPLVVKTTM
jgi:membrane protease YdiL (CAAX protease family)